MTNTLQIEKKGSIQIPVDCAASAEKPKFVFFWHACEPIDESHAKYP